MKLPRAPLLRPGEGRPIATAFAFLAVFFASQAVLEAARDALFLSKVPAAHLPWMYIAIAVLSFAVARGEERLGRRIDSADALVAWVTVAAAGTGLLALWVGAGGAGRWGVYTTYVWSGLVTSLVVARFWALLGGLFSIIDAKRLYGLIGAGSVAGAVVGSALASLTAYVAPAPVLLWLATACFLASIGAASALRRLLGRSPRVGAAEPVRLVRALGLFRRDGYPQRVVAMLVLAAACLTFADYAFKSAIAARLPREQLGVFFGVLGVINNSLSLGVQLVIAPRVIASLGVCGALAVLPAALAMGGVGLAAGLGASAAIAVRVGDGALRYSLHRTAAELLFVPMSPAVRGAMKVLDSLGQRAGQAVASVVLLVLASLGAPPLVVSIGLAVMASAWVVAALELRRYYLDVFRTDLRAGRLGDSVAMRGLDQAALETLFAALDSGEDAEVLAALVVLEREKKAHLVPGLILYHPSLEVVWRAADLFVETGRTSVVPTLDRLARDPSVERRAVAIISRTMLASDRAALEAWLADETSPELRPILRYLLVRHGVGSEADARAVIDEVRAHGSPAARAWLASAIALDRAPTHDQDLVAMAADDSPVLRRRLPRLLAMKGTPAALQALGQLLADERSREASVHALVAAGQQGLGVLLEALNDDDTPAVIAWHVPRALTHFAPGRVLPALMARMQSARDGMVRFRCLRAIERLVALDPSIVLDRVAVAAEARRTVERAEWCLARRLQLEEGRAEQPARGTGAHGLVAALLRDKERHAVDRALRLLGLIHRGGDYADVRRGLASADPRIRASAVELLGHVAPAELRDALLALVGTAPDAERWAQLPDQVAQRARGYRAIVEELADGPDPNLADLARYHRAELDAPRASLAPVALEATS